MLGLHLAPSRATTQGERVPQVGNNSNPYISGYMQRWRRVSKHRPSLFPISAPFTVRSAHQNSCYEATSIVFVLYSTIAAAAWAGAGD